MKNKRKRYAVCVAALTVSAILYGIPAEAETEYETKKVQENSTDMIQKISDESDQDGEVQAEETEEVMDSEEILEEESGDTVEDSTDVDDETTEVILDETEEEHAEQELILEPEYQPEKDPSPLGHNIQQYLGEKELEQIHPIELEDSERIAINGEKATCTSFARLQYGYTPDVQVGTIRYISQIAGSGLFDWSYWGGWGNQAGIECGTASISMAMSYIGVNLTPQQILDAHGGLTCFTGWGVTDLSPDVSTGMEQYINGRGQYSPLIVHLPTYSQLGHYVVLIGKVSESEYLVLDCAQNSTWVMSVGDGFYNSIDQVYQYYNPDAPVLEHTIATDKPVMASCIHMGLTAGAHCEVCGEILTQQQVVPCNGHAWSDWVTKAEPTTQRQGEKSRICLVCGQKDNRSIDRLPEEMQIEIPHTIWKNDLLQ